MGAQVGQREKWIRKAWGYFDNKPGKLVACPPEIGSSNAQVSGNPAGSGQSPEPSTAASSVGPPQDTFARPAGGWPAVPSEIVSGQRPALTVAPSLGTTAGKPSQQPSPQLLGQVSVQSSARPSAKPSGQPPLKVLGDVSALAPTSSSALVPGKLPEQPPVRLPRPVSVQPSAAPSGPTPGKPPGQPSAKMSAQVSAQSSADSSALSPGKLPEQPSWQVSRPGHAKRSDKYAEQTHRKPPTSAVPGLEIRVDGDAIRVWRTGALAPRLEPNAREVARSFLTWLEGSLPVRRWVQVCELELLFEAHRAEHGYDYPFLTVLRELKKLTGKKQRDVSPTARSRVHYLVGPEHKEGLTYEVRAEARAGEVCRRRVGTAT